MFVMLVSCVWVLCGWGGVLLVRVRGSSGNWQFGWFGAFCSVSLIPTQQLKEMNRILI